MGKTEYIRETETESISGDRIFLCYFITYDEERGSSNGRCYGVGIDMYTQKAGQRTDKMRKSINNIFRTKLEAELFIQILYSGYVTPTSLEDVVDDNIIEKI